MSCHRTLFGGDLLVEGGTIVVPGGPRWQSCGRIWQSLERIDALKPLVAYPAHGDVIEAPLALIAHYRAHRAGRERQILEAIPGGAGSVTAIAAPGVP